MSALEEALLQQIRDAGLPEPEREYRFAKLLGRTWRLDFAWPGEMFAVECNGGTWTDGRHNRGVGMENDAVKGDVATLLGWRVLTVTNHMVADGRAIRIIRGVLEGFEAEAAEWLAGCRCRQCDARGARKREEASGRDD